jgi:hypothetical protein
LTRPARLTSSRTVFLLYCSGDCHSPYFACDRSQPGKPDPLPPHAGVCFVCDQHRIAKKHQPVHQHRREGGSKRGLFLVWPGGEAVKKTAPPRSQARAVDCITNPTRERGRKRRAPIRDFTLEEPSLARRVGRRVVLTLRGSRRTGGRSRNCGMVPMWPY